MSIVWDSTPFVAGRPAIEPPCPRCGLPFLDGQHLEHFDGLDRFGVQQYAHIGCAP